MSEGEKALCWGTMVMSKSCWASAYRTGRQGWESKTPYGSKEGERGGGGVLGRDLAAGKLAGVRRASEPSLRPPAFIPPPSPVPSPPGPPQGCWLAQGEEEEDEEDDTEDQEVGETAT